MSDTDDTDELLLIPPDLFSCDIQEPLKPYYSIVDNLISKVSSLEGRINHLDTSLMSNSSDNLVGARQFSSLDEIPQNVEFTPPKLGRYKTKQTSLPSTPHDAARRQNTQAGIDEINSFIKHVKTIKKHQAARNLTSLFETDKDNNDNTRLWALESKGATSITSEPLIKNEKTWKTGEKKGSVPDRGMGMRDLLYENSEPSAPASLFSQGTTVSDLSSSDSTQLTVHESLSKRFDKVKTCAMEVLEKHNNSLSASEGDLQNSNVERRRLVLMSLSELWEKDLAGAGDFSEQELRFQNKLQEEKLRRKYCEQLLQHVQGKNLELQECLSVAIQVDEAKEDAIIQIHKSWEEANRKIDDLVKQKTQFESQIKEMSAELTEAAKKTGHHESEASKALNLAHISQEKVTTLEKQNASLKVEIESYESRLKKLEMDYEREHENTQHLSKLLGQKDLELNENKNVQVSATKEIAQSKRAVEMCQTELIAIKGRQVQFESKYNEALLQIKDLEEDKKKSKAEIDSDKKTEKTLRDDLAQLRQTNEQSKADLHTYYQNKVELVVRDKLKDFQKQLEKAQGALKDEVQSRELAVAKNAASHIQQINEKNVLEIRLLEEKHKEEIKLYKLQQFQLQQEISNLQVKVQQQQERRANVVQQLQKVMEAQWAEALKIINGKTPPVQDKNDQLNHLKSRSYNNLEEILFREEGSSNRGTAMRLFDNTSVNSTLDDSFGKIEVPVKHDKNKQQNEQEMQKFIQMLINKQPTHLLDEPLFKQDVHENQHGEGSKQTKPGHRDRTGKRPWK